MDSGTMEFVMKILLCCFLSMFLITILGLVFKKFNNGFKNSVEFYESIFGRISFFDKFNQEDLKTYLKRGKLNWSPTKYMVVRFVIPGCLLLCCIPTFLLGQTALGIWLIIMALVVNIFPKSKCDGEINKNNLEWQKFSLYIWKLKEVCAEKDFKNSTFIMEDFFAKRGCKYLAEDWRLMQNYIPNDAKELLIYRNELEKNFCEIALLVWDSMAQTYINSQNPIERLSTVENILELKYEDFANDQLNVVPTKATLYSLPFLILAVCISILIPCLARVLSYL